MRRLTFAIVVAGVAFSCSGGFEPEENDGGGDGGPTTVGCSADPRVVVAAPGVTVPVSGSPLSLQIVSTTPAPPARGTNAWVVRLTSTEPGAEAAAQVAEVTPTMPDHGHGSSVKPTLFRRPDGDYEIGSLSLVMPGVWTIAFRIQQGDGTQATATVSICIAG